MGRPGPAQKRSFAAFRPRCRSVSCADIWRLTTRRNSPFLAERTGSIVMLASDGGRRYLDTYYDDNWLAAQGCTIEAPLRAIEVACLTGRWSAPPIGEEAMESALTA